MAKYRNSPLGTINGKLGEVVCATIRGTNFVRRHCKKINDRASLQKLDDLRKNKIERKEINEKKINAKYIFKIMSQFTRECYGEIVFPAFYKKARDLGKLPFNIMLKENMNTLLNTIPDKKRLCDDDNNIDMLELRLTPEYAGMPMQVSAGYNPENGEIVMNWKNNKSVMTSIRGETQVIYEENLEDKAYCVAFYLKPKPLISWVKDELPWQEFKVWGSAVEEVGKRGNEVAKLRASASLDTKYLFAYVFFKKSNSNFSRTYGAKTSRLLSRFIGT